MKRIVNVLGEDQQYTPVGGVARTVRAEFQDPAAEFLDVQTSQPMVVCMAADVSTAKRGDTWVVFGVTYKGLTPKIDSSSGMVEIPLEKQ